MGQDRSSSAGGRELHPGTPALSRLRMTDHEISELVPQLERVLEHVDKLASSPDGALRPSLGALVDALTNPHRSPVK